MPSTMPVHSIPFLTMLEHQSLFLRDSLFMKTPNNILLLMQLGIAI